MIGKNKVVTDEKIKKRFTKRNLCATIQFKYKSWFESLKHVKLIKITGALWPRSMWLQHISLSTEDTKRFRKFFV